MAATLILTTLLAVALTPAMGLVYRWNGGDMGFSNSANWQGLTPVAPNQPCSTTFGGTNTTIISNLAAVRYNVGQALNLPADGTLLLANDGTVLNFAETSTPTTACSSQNAIWSGGITAEQRNDFTCHQNWLEVRPLIGDVPATTAPCAGDVLMFNASRTYHSSIGQNVPLIAVGSVQFGATTITSNTTAQLSQTLPQIDLFSTSTVVFIGTEADALTQVCGPMNLFKTENNRAVCICTSSCPTPEMERDAESRRLQAVIDLANQTLAAMNTYYVRTFTGTVNAASLFMTTTQFGTALNNPSDPTNSAIAAAVTQALRTLPASVSGVTVLISANNATVTVSGTLNATAGSLLPIGLSTLNPPNNIVWASTNSAIPSNVTRTQMLVQSALSAKIFEVYSSILSAQSQQVLGSQPQSVQDVINAITNTNNPTATLAAITGTSCLTTCSPSCAACQTTLETALTNAGVSNPSTLAGQIVSLTGPSYSDTINTVTNVVDTVTASRSALNSSSQVSMRTYQLNAPTLYIGRSASLANQLLAVASQNNARLSAALAQAIAGYQTLGSVSGLTINFVGQVPTVANRRRAVTQTPSAIAVNFAYNTSCLPTDTVCSTAFTSGSTLGGLIRQRLDDTFNLMALGLAYGQCTSLNTGFNNTCLRQTGRNACAASLAAGSNTTVAQQDTYNAIFNLIRCGIQPSFPNGTCLTDNPNANGDAEDFANDVDCGATTPSPPTIAPASSASSSGGGMSIVPIAAAAGGGALLLAVIALLLLRRKRNNNNNAPVKKMDDRTVVAFENPMYDDPAHNVSAQPTYDAAAPHDGEGLYDEPAFNQNAQKANPVYQSTEDLAAASEYMEQGGAKGDGYLDVAPGAAEDVGYLDGVEKR